MAIIDYPNLTECLSSDGFPERADGWFLKHTDTGNVYIRVSGVWEDWGLGFSFAPPTKSGTITTDANAVAEVVFGTPFPDSEYTVALTCTDPGSRLSPIALVTSKTATGFTLRTANSRNGLDSANVVVSWLATRNYEQMRATTGTLSDLTTALNEAITELGAPVSPATGTLASATSQLNALLSWYMSDLPPADGTLASAVSTYNQFVEDVAVVIARQELQSWGKWWTWIVTEGFDTIIMETDTQMTRDEAIAARIEYLEKHLYDEDQPIVVNIYNNQAVLVDAITYIKINNPTMPQWNAYLATLLWYDAYGVRWFVSMLATELANRHEIDIVTFTEAEVLNRLKTWIINTPPRRIARVVFGIYGI